MAVRCSKCGEELLGPVNRCWKCGQLFATLPDAGGLPPVRGEVPSLATSAMGAAASGGTIDAAAPADAVPTADADPTQAALPPSGGIRTGSPFIPGAMMASVPSQPAAKPLPGNRPKPPPTQQLIRDHAAVAGAVGSLVLGIFGLSVAWMTDPTAVIGAALLALLGLVMGMWGLYSRRRGWALFGMLLCVGAISLASYSGAMLIYEAQLEAREMEGQLE